MRAVVVAESIARARVAAPAEEATGPLRRRVSEIVLEEREVPLQSVEHNCTGRKAFIGEVEYFMLPCLCATATETNHCKSSQTQPTTRSLIIWV